VRKLLLAGVAALVLSAPQAEAVDVWCSNCQTIWQAAQQAMQQLQQLEQQLTMLQEQYQMLVNTYQTFTHITDLGSAVSALQSVGIQNPLPVNPSAVQNLLSGSGTGGLTGISSSLSGLFNQSWNTNHVYTPTGSSWEAQQVQQNANSIAGAQSLAQQLYQSVAQRIPLMQQLEEELSTATDPKTVLDLQARLQAEQSFIQSQQVQAQTLSTMYAAQLQNEQQQLQEERQKEIDQVIAADPD
jgi:type IV secretion system protein VirB5